MTSQVSWACRAAGAAIVMAAAVMCHAQAPGGGAIDATRPIPELLADAAARFAVYQREAKRATVGRPDETRDTAFREAFNLVEAVLKRDPVNTDANLLAGDMAIEANDYDSARKYFQTVLEVEPNNYRANYGLGRIWAAARSWRQALLFLQAAERVAPDLARASEVRRLMATAYAGSGDSKRAIEKIDEAVRNAPDDLESLRTLAELRMAVAARDPAGVDSAIREAEGYLERVRAEVRNDPASIVNLQKLDAAYDLLLGGLRAQENSYHERNARGEPLTTILRGREVDVAAVLNRIAKTMGEQALLRLTMAQHQIIEISARIATQYDPRCLPCLETLASLQQRVNDTAGAVETCKRILELDPKHQAAREFLDATGAPAPAPAAEVGP